MAERADVYEVVRAFVHETPLSLCTGGSDTCDDHELAEALTDMVMSAGTDLEQVARELAVTRLDRQLDVLTRRDGPERCPRGFRLIVVRRRRREPLPVRWRALEE